MLKWGIISLAAVSATAMAADTAVTPPAPVSPPAPVATPAIMPPVPVATPAKPIIVTADKDVKTPWSGEKIVCTREAPIGSMIPVKHCTTKSNDAQNERNARDLLSRPIAGERSN